jgi:hypothetical protein
VIDSYWTWKKVRSPERSAGAGTKFSWGTSEKLVEVAAKLLGVSTGSVAEAVFDAVAERGVDSCIAGKVAWMRWDGKLDALGIAVPWYRSVEGPVGAAKLVESTDSTLNSVPEMVSWGSNWRGGAAEM